MASSSNLETLSVIIPLGRASSEIGHTSHRRRFSHPQYDTSGSSSGTSAERTPSADSTTMSSRVITPQYDTSGSSLGTSAAPTPSAESRTMSSRVIRSSVKAMAVPDVDSSLFDCSVSEFVDSCVSPYLVQQIMGEISHDLRCLGACSDTVTVAVEKVRKRLRDRFQMLANLCSDAQSNHDNISTILADVENSTPPMELVPANSSKPSDAKTKRKVDPSKTLFVQNLPHTVTEARLRQQFSGAGTRMSAQIRSNRDKAGTCHAFVQFESSGSVKWILRTNPTFWVDEREARCSWHKGAKPDVTQSKDQGRPVATSTTPDSWDIPIMDWPPEDQAPRSARNSISRQTTEQPNSANPDSPTRSESSEPCPTPILDLLYGTRVSNRFRTWRQQSEGIAKITTSLYGRSPEGGFRLRFVDNTGRLTCIGETVNGITDYLAHAARSVRASTNRESGKDTLDEGHALEKALRPFVGINRECFPELLEEAFMQEFVRGNANTIAISKEEYKAVSVIKRRDAEQLVPVNRPPRKKWHKHAISENISAELQAKLQDLFLTS